MGKRHKFAEKPMKLCLVGAIDEDRETLIYCLVETLDEYEEPTGEYVKVEMKIRLDSMDRTSSEAIVFSGFNSSGNAIRIVFFENGKTHLDVFGD